jgi:hypothetical protein
MKTYISPILFLLMPVVFTVSCRSSKSAASSPDNTQGGNWQKQALVIDGSDSDWIRPLPGLESTEKLTYAMTHDGENLYILISTRDPAEQNKILSGGMTVWINNQANKTNDEAIGLGFPLDPHNDREKQLMAEARPQVYKDRSAKLDDADAYELYGFSRQEPIAHYDYGVENKEGVQVRMNYNPSGDLVYEASVPLRNVFPKANNAHYYTGREIAVGIFIEGIPAPPGSKGGGGGGGGVSIGGGLGFGSFGSGGGLGISIGSGSLARLGGKKGSAYSPKKIWHVMTLDKAPARPF